MPPCVGCRSLARRTRPGETDTPVKISAPPLAGTAGVRERSCLGPRSAQPGAHAQEAFCYSDQYGHPVLTSMTARTAHAILIVDDQSWNRELMAELLRGGGYRPLTAAGGEEAFEIARLERPSVVITDVLMSGVNGFELTRRLRGRAPSWATRRSSSGPRTTTTVKCARWPPPWTSRACCRSRATSGACSRWSATRSPAQRPAHAASLRETSIASTRACSATSSSRWRARSTARTSTCARATSASACWWPTSPAPSTGAHSTPN